jgi:molybdenum cofactor cytidylyltransferase
MQAMKLSGLILAAGLSRRTAPQNKLLLLGPGGRPVIRGVAEAFCAAGLHEVIVITGYQRERVCAALSGLPLRCVYAEDYAGGMAHSLAAGIRACDPGSAGFLVSPGDLPGMTADLVRRIADAFCSHQGQHHIIPWHGKIRGHPVALAAHLRPRLETLTGDQGARSLLNLPAEQARTVVLPLSSAAIHADNDAGGEL